jgi:hypothetical protein
MGKMRNTYKILIGKLEGKRPLGRHWTVGRILLKRILQKYNGKVDWTNLAPDGVQ